MREFFNWHKLHDEFPREAEMLVVQMVNGVMEFAEVEIVEADPYPEADWRDQHGDPLPYEVHSWAYAPNGLSIEST